MLMGIVLMVLGFLVFRYMVRKQRATVREQNALDLQQTHYVGLLAKEKLVNQQLTQALTAAMKLGITRTQEQLDSMELQRSVTQDALNREIRAKAALTAVLLKLRVDPEQLARVLREVDGSGGTIDGD